MSLPLAILGVSVLAILLGYGTTVLFVFVVAAIFIARKIYYLGGPKHGIPTQFREEKYWGSGPPQRENEEDNSIRPFTVSVEDSVLSDLKERLSRARIQDSISGTDFEYGFNSNQLKVIIDYWLNKYDWRKEEKELNSLPHFKTKIEGIDIHFVHVTDKGTSKKPALLLVHGWPGSFVEFIDIIPLLSSSFDLVIPSLPGYGFSEEAHKKGMNSFHMGRIFKTLMKRLGYERFIYHGGDWGAFIGKALSITFPDSVIGYHSTMGMTPFCTKNILMMMVAGAGFPHLVYGDNKKDYTKWNPFWKHFSFLMKESGYMHIQATKPDTVGVGLNDSPAGLAAYILEKFSTWTRRDYVLEADGGLTLTGGKYTMDRLLTNVMIYWINGNITSSQRLYKEQFGGDPGNDRYAVTVPTAIIAASNEIRTTPRAILKDYYTDIRSYRDVEGGHFLAFEEPQLVADDIKSFARSVGVNV